MTLTEEQIDYIATNLEFYGVASEELRNDLLDHICTHIEQSGNEDFESAYSEALQKFGGHHAMETLQRDTYLLTTFRKSMRRQKLIYILGFITFFTITVGAIFKWLHWPGANIIAVCGMSLLMFLYLPLYFYNKYHESYKKLMVK